MLSFEEKYKAFLEKDSSFEGIFIVAVKTTGIFCKPSCHARKPKRENIIFYDTVKEALQNGFRPCKSCRPLDNSGEAPEFVKEILNELDDHPYRKLRDYELRKKGVNPAQIRRWFKKNYNLTFHSYQRMLRINNAFNKISNGGKVTDTAFDSGYDSLSGFNDGYQAIFGASPTKTNDKNVINITRISTPLGPMFIGATSKGICLLEFTDRRMLETEFKELRKLLNAVILPGTNEHIERLQKELAEYFERRRKVFTVSLDIPGTDFQKAVWKELIKIPYGETASYKEQAIKLNNPNAVRAVGSANGHNRISIIVPCHRVIGEDGSLTGYGGGLSRKRWLLDFEKKHSISAKQAAFEFDEQLTF
jgi:AraC family transcriptional regulator, regulatory protein of adaptative response / methylated-DNA-[protein]-cysteine methyltransferase